MNDITNTPNFINWFGDWKTGNNCSKVIDKKWNAFSCISWDKQRF